MRAYKNERCPLLRLEQTRALTQSGRLAHDKRLDADQGGTCASDIIVAANLDGRGWMISVQGNDLREMTFQRSMEAVLIERHLGNVLFRVLAGWALLAMVALSAHAHGSQELPK